jgi:hypothetical protein
MSRKGKDTRPQPKRKKLSSKIPEERTHIDQQPTCFDTLKVDFKNIIFDIEDGDDEGRRSGIKVQRKTIIFIIEQKCFVPNTSMKMALLCSTNRTLIFSKFYCIFSTNIVPFKLWKHCPLYMNVH